MKAFEEMRGMIMENLQAVSTADRRRQDFAEHLGLQINPMSRQIVCRRSDIKFEEGINHV